jgi:hypothetical protein
MKFGAINGSPLFYRVHSQQTSQNARKMNHGMELTRMRVLTYLSESRRLDGMLRNFTPFLPLILARKYHHQVPLSSSFIGKHILECRCKFNYLTRKLAERMLKEAEECLKGDIINSRKFCEDLKMISDNSEFQSFKRSMTEGRL